MNYIFISLSIYLVCVIVSFIMFNKSKTTGFYLLLTFVLILIYFNFSDHVADNYRPSIPKSQLQKLVSSDSHSYESYIVTANSDNYLLLELQTSQTENIIRDIALLTMPPLYIFDENGRMIDWTNDLDDDPEFSKKWNLSSMKPIELSNYLGSMNK